MKKIEKNKSTDRKNGVIPVFYACDDNFIAFAAVSLRSLLDNCAKTRRYDVHFLVTAVSDENRKEILSMKTDFCDVTFDDVTPYLKELTSDLPIRDYYSKTTYYRLFIADMFPEYDKVIYIDSDTVVEKDISELFDTDIDGMYAGAVHERVMSHNDTFGAYVEQVLGIDKYAYFNAGVLLINAARYREHNILKKFGELLGVYDFVVTQDEDYLNLLFKDRVKLLHGKWNAEIYDGIPCKEREVAIFHYIMTSKPWHYKNCEYADHFWKYAKKTSYFELLQKQAENYSDADRERDDLCGKNLVLLAEKEIAREDNYLRQLRKKQDAGRVAVLGKIEELEKSGVFDVDVEQDPPTKPLPDKVDYLRKNVLAKLKARHAFYVARKFLHGMIENDEFIIDKIEGGENLRSVEGGAILTCNHFNAFDSFAMQLAYEQADTKKHKFYRVIREGNYTSFGGFYGYLMRNCYTLPLGSDMKHMKMFTCAVSEILKNNGFVLVYAEQSMWWNYRKPKPLKKGAFSMAATNGVPVVPCFITMRDTDKLDENGFKVQEYTIHIGKPIYPDENKSIAQNISYMMAENAAEWQQTYERFYGVPLRYDCHEQPFVLREQKQKA